MTKFASITSVLQQISFSELGENEKSKDLKLRFQTFRTVTNPKFISDPTVTYLFRLGLVVVRWGHLTLTLVII